MGYSSVLLTMNLLQVFTITIFITLIVGKILITIFTERK